jgi:hypothetical protein
MPTWKAYAKKDDITATKLDDFAAPDDNTDLNATAAAHGLLPKLSNVATQYLSGTGVFSVPAGGGPTIVRKTADETVNNSAVLQNDDHLLLAIAANEVWLVDVFLLWTSPSTTPALKTGWAYPNGCSIKWGVEIEPSATPKVYWSAAIATASKYALLIETGTRRDILSVAAAICGLHLTAIVINGATAGTLNLQWAQYVATAENTQVLANSCLIAHKLA